MSDLSDIDDFRLMARAIQLAKKGLYSTHPNPRVGCVIARNNEIVGEGWHQKSGQAHAEINALNDAAGQAKNSVAYVTLEPCCHFGKTPPCADALINAGVSRVVVAMQDPNPLVAGKGIARLRDAGIEVIDGVLDQEAKLLNPGFIKRMSTGLPYVRCKLAMGLDGRTAMASGESKWITGDQARRDVHCLRAQSSVVMTGIGTVLADDPFMTVRIEKDYFILNEVPEPLRVILDSSLRTPIDAKIFNQPGKVIIFTSTENNDYFDSFDVKKVSFCVLPEIDGGLDLQAVLIHLAKLEVNEILLEAGATLCGSMLKMGLLDEIVIYMAPHVMGANARGLFNLPAIDKMSDRIKLKYQDVRQVGDDLKITLQAG